MTKIRRLVMTAIAAAATVGLTALPAHAGWNNHNETLLKEGR